MTSVLINIRQRETELKKTKQSKTEAEIDWCGHETRTPATTRNWKRPGTDLPPGLSEGIKPARLFFFYIYFYLFLWLCWVLVVACKIFSCGMWTLSCGMWDLVPWPGIKSTPLHWEHRVSATDHQGSSWSCCSWWSKKDPLTNKILPINSQREVS